MRVKRILFRAVQNNLEPGRVRKPKYAITGGVISNDKRLQMLKHTLALIWERIQLQTILVTFFGIQNGYANRLRT